MNSITRIKCKKEIKIKKNENLFITSESSQADALQIGAMDMGGSGLMLFIWASMIIGEMHTRIGCSS